MNKSKGYIQYTTRHFASFVSEREKDLPEQVKKIIKSAKLRFRYLTPEESNKAIKDVAEVLIFNKLTKVGAHRKGVWNKGWLENLKNFENSGYDLDKLLPKYFHKERPFRLNGFYATSPDNFEVILGGAFKYWLFSKYFKNCPEIYEFGCGSGINVLMLSQIFPDKVIHGLDWVKPSKKILDRMAKHHGLKVRGHIFDMFKPENKFPVREGSGILLFSVFEQMGTSYKKFIDYILKKKPSIIVHVDTLEELYDKNNLHDYLAWSYGIKRDYISGYLKYMKKLKKDKKVKILKIQRMHLGNLFMDGYSFDVWKPIYS